MYRIGEFSRITGITIKALRYYHEHELLVPSEIDEFSGYRMYTKKQVINGNYIRLLRDLDFSIKEIKEINDASENFEDITYYMEEKVSMVETEINRLEEVKETMRKAIERRKEVRKMNEYEVSKKTIDEISVISVRYKGRYDECGTYIGQLYKAAKGAVSGNVMNLYYDTETAENANIEVCLPVKKPIKAEGVTYRALPRVDVLSIIHVGPYDNLGDAYQAITDYMIENKIEATIPSREIYIKGPGMIFKGNPNKYVTEIQMVL